ncbi:MAG: enoyl-CoA hydratase/isomerase family protein [Betaproteobacteria bacterium]|nr:enoyl-CoA hydratase/isomerase family protein [Betaproteobacteria bacterium]
MSDAFGSSSPILTIEGVRATIRFNRPREHNCIDPADLPVLRDHLTAVAQSPGIRALVFTGTGAKTFSSGYTLQALIALDASDHSIKWDALMDTIEAFPISTVAAMNGSVYGGATDLALACDFRVGVTGSRFVMPAMRIGLHYYSGAMRRYVERLGLSAAKRLFLLGDPVPCEEMNACGFYDALVAPADFDARVTTIVESLSAGAPAVVRSMKRHLNAIARGEMDAAAIDSAYIASQQSDDLKEGIAAMQEKRAAKFKDV